MLGTLEVHVDVELTLDLCNWNLLDQRKLIHGLRVVSHRTIRVDGDSDRAHSEEAEGYKPEREDGGCEHERNVSSGQVRAQPHGADVIANRHQSHHGHSQPIGGEVSGHQSGKNVERRAALARRGYDLSHVTRISG